MHYLAGTQPAGQTESLTVVFTGMHFQRILSSQSITRRPATGSKRAENPKRMYKHASDTFASSVVPYNSSLGDGRYYDDLRMGNLSSCTLPG